MTAEFQSVITMTNSIIGVSVLAMPFCFRQCGIVLATLMLLMSGYLVKMSCHLLVKSASISRRRNYETLAFHSFGAAGKMTVEVSMIGFMVGTCIAFFVVIGDLAPPILASVLNVSESVNFAYAVQSVICFFLVLPLTLLRNLESLFAVSISSVVFYCCVMLHIIIAAKTSIFDGTWTTNVLWWRPAGIFQCLPIFCMALACQCQVFEIYESLPDPSLSLMNEIVRGAVNICSGVYIAVGLFGYIACSEMEFGGNILTALPQSSLLEIVKLGFVLSIAVSFPLVVFPCRTSIHSLIYRKGNSHSEVFTNYIPTTRFNVITVIVVLATFVTGILLPDIEFILGIVGSTIGNVICIIFPSMIFLRLTTRNTTERLGAQAIFILGVILMILGTYVNLNEADVKTSSHSRHESVEIQHQQVVDVVNLNPPEVKESPAIKKPVIEDEAFLPAIHEKSPLDGIRKEPIEPVAPDNIPVMKKDEESVFNKYDTLGIGKQLKEKEQELHRAEGLNQGLGKQKEQPEQQEVVQSHPEISKEPKNHEAEELQKPNQPVLVHSDAPKLDPDIPKNQSPHADVEQNKLPDPPLDVLKVIKEPPQANEKPFSPDIRLPSPILELRMDNLAVTSNSSDLVEGVHDVKEM